jgi:hypothetical protein
MAIILMLKKPNKDDYTISKAYRSIALLNIIGKLLKLIIVRRFTSFAENYNLLSNTQIDARAGRSIEIVLQLIIKQIHIIWSLLKPQKVAILLNINIFDAFDNVLYEKLIYNLRKKRVPSVIIDWVRSFLQDRITTIKLFEGESQSFSVITGISQSSLISPILFLFFIADLLSIISNDVLQIFLIGFVNDVNILIYRKSTERNCKILKEIYYKCKK